MKSLYGNNSHKQRGIKREPLVANRILKFLQAKDLSITMRKASRAEDIHKKYDYEYTCGVNESFSKRDKINNIKVDIKCGRTFTLIDTLGRNTLTNSKSHFIVFELYPDAPELLWVNTGKLKECLLANPPKLTPSKEKNNNSKYFYIENYISANKLYLGKFVEYIK